MNQISRKNKSVKKAITILTGILILVFSMELPGMSGTARAAADPYTALDNATTVYQGIDYGSEYNALDYYLNYTDIQQAIGADPFGLLEHYVLHGRAEGRIANRMIQSTTVVVPSGDDSVAIINVVKHDNGGMTSAQEVKARSIASQIAKNIKQSVATYQASDGAKAVTEVEIAAYAAGVVKAYLDRGTLTTTGDFASNAYGVFVVGQYNSAGATRALGLVFDYLGITWEHANIGTSEDQWCKIIADGVEAYADATEGAAGTGKSPNEGGSGKAVTYADVRKKFSIYN